MYRFLAAISKTSFLLLGLWVGCVLPLNGQSQDEGIELTLETPYNTVLVHLYYLQPDSYQPELAARTLANVQDSARASRLAI